MVSLLDRVVPIPTIPFRKFPRVDKSVIVNITKLKMTIKNV